MQVGSFSVLFTGLFLGFSVVSCGQSPFSMTDVPVVDTVSQDVNLADIPQCSVQDFRWGRAGEFMLPGTACVNCHNAQGTARMHPFSVAGTVFRSRNCYEGVSGVTVHIQDSANTTVNLTTNEEGNFFTAMPLVSPYTVAVSVGSTRREMSFPSRTGDCNSCHNETPDPGVIFIE